MLYSFFSVFAQNKQKRSKGFVNVRDINQGINKLSFDLLNNSFDFYDLFEKYRIDSLSIKGSFCSSNKNKICYFLNLSLTGQLYTTDLDSRQPWQLSGFFLYYLLVTKLECFTNTRHFKYLAMYNYETYCNQICRYFFVK